MPRLIPYLALSTSILLGGFGALMIRWAEAPGPVVTFYWMVFSTLVLSPFALKRLKVSGSSHAWVVLLVPLIGGVFKAGDYGLWSTGVILTSAANATLLNYTAPLWVSLFAWRVLHERMRKIFWYGLALTLGGAFVVLGSDLHLAQTSNSPQLAWGGFIALASSLFYAAYFLITQRGRQKLDSVTYMWLVGVSSSICLAIACASLELPLTGYPPRTYGLLVVSALIFHLISNLLVTYALGSLSASVVSPTLALIPVTTAICGMVFLGETLIPAQVLGGLFVLIGVTLVHRGKKRLPPLSTASICAVPSTPALHGRDA